MLRVYPHCPRAGNAFPVHLFLPEGLRYLPWALVHRDPGLPHGSQSLPTEPLPLECPGAGSAERAGSERLTCSEEIFARTSGLGVPTTSMIRFSWSMSVRLRKCPLARNRPFPGPQIPDLGALPKTCSPTAGVSEPKGAPHGAEKARSARKGQCPPPLRPTQHRGLLAHPPPTPGPRIQSLPGKRAFPWSSSAMMQPTDQMSTVGEGGSISPPSPRALPRIRVLPRLCTVGSLLHPGPQTADPLLL